MAQHLVLTSAADAGATLRRHARVQSQLPPRLWVTVVGEETSANTLRGLAGVEAVISTATEPLPSTLSEDERLFAQAWQLSLQFPEKRREGADLNWGAEGFLPPDLPNPGPR
jgi:hypothetical protein